MKLPRRKFVHLAVGAAALPVVSRVEETEKWGKVIRAANIKPD